MYGEVMIGVNMIFNYIILRFAHQVGGLAHSKKRLLFAAFIGAIPVVFFPHSIISTVIALIVMLLTAFGWNGRYWRKVFFLVLIGALFTGGVLTAIQLKFQTSTALLPLAMFAVIAYFSLSFFRKKWIDVRITHQTAPLFSQSILQIWGKEIALLVYIDSGNGCVEPISGAPVHFISYRSVVPILPEELNNALQSWNPSISPTFEQFPSSAQKNMRLIRITTVQGHSWAIGFKYDKWTLQNGQQLPPGYVVITKNDRRYPESAAAILHVSAMDCITEERSHAYAT